MDGQDARRPIESTPTDEMQTPEAHLFTLHSEWRGSSDGDGVLTAERDATLAYGIPEGTGGKPGRSNPEEMLVGAVVSCYSITLAMLLEKRRLPAFPIVVTAVGTVTRQPDHRLKFTGIHLRPRITVYGLNEAQQAKVLELAHTAERVCLVSNALADDVTITVTPEIVQEQSETRLV